MQIYIGGLGPEATDSDVRAMFEAFGTVASAVVGRTKEGESQGYALVVMPVKAEARAAVEGLRGSVVKGALLRVRILKPGDEFHDHVHLLAAKGSGGSAGYAKAQRFRGEPGPRASGAVRRSGRRGS